MAVEDKWRLALEGLTPQGSEYYNDLDRCVGHVRRQYLEGHEAKKDRVRLRRENESLQSQLTSALDKVAQYERMMDKSTEISFTGRYMYKIYKLGNQWSEIAKDEWHDTALEAIPGTDS